MGNDYGAVSLNGSTQYFSAASQSALNLGVDDFSLDVAFTVGGGTGIRPLINKWGSNVGWAIQINGDGKIEVLFNSLTYTSTTAISDTDTWHFVQVCVDRSVQRAFIFIDGTLDGSLNVSGQGTVSNSESLLVGKDSSARYWNGKITEVRLSTKPRNTATFTQDYRQFSDDPYAVALYHFNEAYTGSTYAYDMSTTRAHLTAAGSPTYVAGPFLPCVVTICREQIWLALDSYTYLTTFFTARGGEKYRFRPEEPVPSNWFETKLPALTVVPASLPDIEPETSAFHAVLIPIEVRGYMHHVDVSEVEYFWWLTVNGIWNMYDLTTAGRFNFARIQNMKQRGPSFNVQEVDKGFFSEFMDTFVFEVRHDFL